MVLQNYEKILYTYWFVLYVISFKLVMLCFVSSKLCYNMHVTNYRDLVYLGSPGFSKFVSQNLTHPSKLLVARTSRFGDITIFVMGCKRDKMMRT